MYRAKDRTTGEEIALKIIDFENAEDDVEDIQKEISMLSQCNSPHITRYYGSYLKGASRRSALSVSLSHLPAASACAAVFPGCLMTRAGVAAVHRDGVHGGGGAGQADEAAAL